MKTGCAILVACALVMGTSLGSHGNVQTIAPCRPGFSQSFYTVLVPRGVLQGLNIHKACGGVEGTLSVIDMSDVLVTQQVGGVLACVSKCLRMSQSFCLLADLDMSILLGSPLQPVPTISSSVQAATFPSISNSALFILKTCLPQHNLALGCISTVRGESNGRAGTLGRAGEHQVEKIQRQFSRDCKHWPDTSRMLMPRREFSGARCGLRVEPGRGMESRKFRLSCLHNCLIWLRCTGVRVSDSSQFSRYCLALVSKAWPSKQNQI
ncbi:hypothetical protein QQF64_003702 [Cirrhinus molitorella]|uniref:Uncharacterized protein n=1 Tax=Cirrhinus molitorella TaxID=172907 RepID=A0ABR3MM36_9TELE